MSHAAVNWAMSVKGLSPAQKIVLIHLADRHNPDNGCFPSQSRLAADCEMSRATLNRHLNALEESGLIRREQRYAEDGSQRSTLYHLKMRHPLSQNETPPVSAVRHPLSQNETHNQVRLTSKKNQYTSSFDEWWQIYPRKVGKGAARRAYEKAIKTTDPASLISAAKRYAHERKGEDQKYTAHPATWLNQERWADEAPATNVVSMGAFGEGVVVR